jgi:pseudouridine kinase
LERSLDLFPPMPTPLPPVSPRIDNPAAVVIGGALIDRKFRTAHVPVLRTSNPATVTVSAGGVGRNVAENLARMGVTVALVSAIGRDPDGDYIVGETEVAGVDMRHTVVTARPTGTYAALLDDTGDLLIAVSSLGALGVLGVDAIDARRALIANAQLLILDCNLPTPALVRAAEVARASGAAILVDPVSVPRASGIDVLLQNGIPIHTITPNLDEVHTLTSVTGSSRTDLCAAARELHLRGVQNVWIRMGVHGSFFSTADQRGDNDSGATSAKVQMIAAAAATQVDATGAGDAMLAGYVAGLLDGLDTFAAAQYGRAAAAITVESDRTVSPVMSMSLLRERLAGFTNAKSE